jgi:hypothetical protein
MMETHALSSLTFAAYKTLRDELIMHPKALQIRAQLTTGTASVGWSKVDGILMFQGHAFLLNDSTLWQQLLEHDNEFTTLCITVRCARKIRSIIYI